MEINSKELWPGWETVGQIGRGSYGAVYEIERDVFGHIEKAALKVISIPQSDSDIDELYDSGYDKQTAAEAIKSRLEGIVNEYTLMREMNGASNIVNCDDFRIIPHADGIGWDILIKMELLTPLTRALDVKPSDEQVIRVAKDMCRALILCRKYGIIHRDIKPQNIFVSKNGDYKLGDFGIAKSVEKTSGGTKVGTYKYMAPEVFNFHPYNQTADIYSLGLVLHWLLNERRSPFVPLPPAPVKASEEDEGIAKRFMGTPIPAPMHGSDALRRIVLKACSFFQQDRYQCAEDMLRDLEQLGGAWNGAQNAAVPPLSGEDATTVLHREEATTVLPREDATTVLHREEATSVLRPPETPTYGGAQNGPAAASVPDYAAQAEPQKAKSRKALLGGAIAAAALALIAAAILLVPRAASGKAAPSAAEAPGQTAAASTSAQSGPSLDEEWQPLEKELLPYLEKQDSRQIAGILFRNRDNQDDREFFDAMATIADRNSATCACFCDVSPDESCYETARAIAEDGYTIIVSAYSGHEPFMIQIAKEFPEVEVFQLNGRRAALEQLPNFHNFCIGGADLIADELLYTADGSYEVALITDGPEVKDNGVNQICYDGVKLFAAANGASYRYYLPGGTLSEADYYDAILNAVNNGAKAVVCTNFLQSEAMERAAKKYPDVKFIFVEGWPTGSDNVTALTCKYEQSAFLAGYAAVMEGYTKLGFCGAGGGENPAINGFGYGFVQGAAAAAEQKGVRVEMRYAYGEGYAPSPEFEAIASKMAADGTEVIFAGGGGILYSILPAAEQTGGKVIGHSTNQNGLSDAVLTSAMLDWSPAIVRALERAFDGTWNMIGGTTWLFGAESAVCCLPTDKDDWKFEHWSVEDYKTLVAQISTGSIPVDTDYGQMTQKSNPYLNLSFVN